MQIQMFLKSTSSGTKLYPTKLSNIDIPSIDIGIPSPQDTEISDPDGCSLVAPSKWKSSRCSCSGSPTRSMSIELYMEDDPPVRVSIIEQQEYLLQQQRLQQYQIQRSLERQRQLRDPTFRRPKVLASMESDGLSSSASSSPSDEMFNSEKAQQFCHDYVANLNNLYSKDTKHKTQYNAMNQALVNSTSNSSDRLSPNQRSRSARSSRSSQSSNSDHKHIHELHKHGQHESHKQHQKLHKNQEKHKHELNKHQQLQQLKQQHKQQHKDQLKQTQHQELKHHDQMKHKENEQPKHQQEVDKRFPLLRQGALGNGSVLNNKR